jgi:diaminopimelate decarboxylase
MLPPVQPGDHLVISHVGAYNNTQWLQFIEYRPAVVMIDRQGRPHVIRRREQLQDVIGAESIPDYLKQ